MAGADNHAAKMAAADVELTTQQKRIEIAKVRVARMEANFAQYKSGPDRRRVAR